MKFIKTIFVAVSAAMLLASGCSRYETVKKDPLSAKIYTLDNGLKVYMSVNKEKPRIQTYIAVRSGGKNDPSDNTGLAHYLEHLMFKGTTNYGTSDYEAEKPLLDTIQALFDIYRTKTDRKERLDLYHVIDSISYEASKLAIPNEYDKLMSMIGAEGTNAFTSNDVTCYTEDIPSNQVENWAKVQSDRFKNMVIRGFHTELEAVYEEKNMGLTDDGEKVFDALDSMLFRNHPYGTQTVIGTQDHLKNPSITAIKKQKATYYVPNNCAICLSGDFDPDTVVGIIKKYFGDWEPNPDLPAFEFKPEEPILSPAVKDVLGQEAEFVSIAWRYPGMNSFESEIADIASSILYNGMAGLVDLDLNKRQKTLESSAYAYGRTDYGMLVLEGYPLEGQSLEEVRDLLLSEVDKLRKGEFSDTLVTATYNNWKLRQMRSLENNGRRAMAFVNSFINGTTWKTEVGRMDRLAKVTKDDVVAWADKWLGENGYAIVYKRMGTDTSVKKIEAPKITPIVTNRDKQSAFLNEIQNSVPEEIEPVFTDFSKDMSKFDCKGLEVLYKHNDNNDITTLNLRFDTGLLQDPALGFALDYVSFLGTPSLSSEQIASLMYTLACRFYTTTDASVTTVAVNGLDENIGKAVAIVDDLLANAVGDEEILANLKAQTIKDRADSKLNQRACFNALTGYVIYGPEYISRTTLTNDALLALTSEELLAKVRNLAGKMHRVLYYGPSTEAALRATLEENHTVSDSPEPLTLEMPVPRQTSSSVVVFANYPSRQFYYWQYSNRGEKYDASQEPSISLFNDYFGGGMNTVVFQEMREARALAYSASAYLDNPSFKDDSYSFWAFIASQNDKLTQAVEAFDQIINDMPKSDNAFEIAKSSLISRLRTERRTGIDVLGSYLSCERLGISEPASKAIFEAAPGLTLDDLAATQEKWVKDRTYVYGILGDRSDMDMKFLSTLGPVKTVSPEDIFGY
ncbi:MAG: insulinase family protein [Bacteroidales bacterium]|nr:insulinase family protein [Bacteroidales bacterium]